MLGVTMNLNNSIRLTPPKSISHISSHEKLHIKWKTNTKTLIIQM